MSSAPVVSDTTSLKYVMVIQEIDVFPKLYGSVCIAEEVAIELSRRKAPAPVREWIAAPPSWLRVVSAPPHGPDLAFLDAGERDTILVAEHLHARFIVIDDWAGRRAAEARSIWCTGMLGLLAEAAALGLLDLPAAFSKLHQTSFRMPQLVVDHLLRQDTIRRSS